MPNYVRNIIQLSGPLSSMEKLLPHANACIEEGMDIFRLIVSEDTEPRGTWNVQGMDSYLKSMGYSRWTRFLGSKWATIDDIEIQRLPNQTPAAILIYSVSAWDPIVDWCQNIRDPEVTSFIIYYGEIDILGARVIRDGKVLHVKHLLSQTKADKEYILDLYRHCIFDLNAVRSILIDRSNSDDESDDDSKAKPKPDVQEARPVFQPWIAVKPKKEECMKDHA